jgi:hypothetical protein
MYVTVLQEFSMIFPSVVIGDMVGPSFPVAS